jgi:CRISPR/Cas system-associated endoribonuclease Cas2
MATYIVSYDLVKPGRNYEDLYNAIRSYGNWGKVNESVWAIVTATTAAQVRDNLSKYMDANDRIFVVKSGSEAAWRNAICKNEWLKENL